MRIVPLAAYVASIFVCIACGAAGGTDTPGDDGDASTGGKAGASAGAGGASTGGATQGGAAGDAGASPSGGTSGAGGGGTSNGGTSAGGTSAGGTNNGGTNNGGTSAGGTSAGGTSAAGAAGGGVAGDPFGGGGSAGTQAGGSGGAGGSTGECDGVQSKPEVFGHSAGTLYRLDPDTKAVTTVGPLSGCQTVIDIALDKAGNMYGTTATGFVSINKYTGACTAINLGSYPNSLSFVPAGTLDPNVEALVGYNGSTYVRIDTKTGTVKTVGALTGGYSSSGDIVSVIGGGTYLTVTGANCGDCLVEVNPKTGDKIGTPVKLSYSQVYGLAYWAGQAYGFTNGGKLFSLDLVTKQTTEIAIANKPAGLSFYGAGSTTCALRGKE